MKKMEKSKKAGKTKAILGYLAPYQSALNQATTLAKAQSASKRYQRKASKLKSILIEDHGLIAVVQNPVL